MSVNGHIIPSPNIKQGDKTTYLGSFRGVNKWVGAHQSSKMASRVPQTGRMITPEGWGLGTLPAGIDQLPDVVKYSYFIPYYTPYDAMGSRHCLEQWGCWFTISVDALQNGLDYIRPLVSLPSHVNTKNRKRTCYFEVWIMNDYEVHLLITSDFAHTHTS